LQVAWLSLDESDNDLTRFLTYLVAAVQAAAEQTAEADVGKAALSALQSQQPPPTEVILTSLINEWAALPSPLVLVLDDYHLIEAQSVHAALTFLLRHMPSPSRGMHLAIITRDDPPLPLARLRARDQLTELRATDLRFTRSEAAEFLNQTMRLAAMGLDLSTEDIAALERRTEGWIVGLQLAALSMRGREDVPGFIKAFAGDNRYIVDYLVQEVLQRQPEHVRSFLLQTSILDRLCGPLCDAVRFGGTETPGQENGKVMLASLEGSNLFVVPLDDKRQWYRYHRLFADVLHSYLMEEQPDQVPTLHRRASEWYEQNELPAETIRHALAAEDYERAAGLVELAWPAMDASFQLAAWLGWAKVLPDELIRARPVLSVAYAWALFGEGELDAGEARLRDAERWEDALRNSAGRGDARPAGTCPERSRRMVVVDEGQFRSLPVTIANARAYYAQSIGDGPASIKYARRALDLLPEENHFGRGRAAVLLGLVYWANGDLEAAIRSFADAKASFEMAGNIRFAISFTFIQANIMIAQGRLREALSIYKQSMQLVSEAGEPELPEAAELQLGLSELHRERGELQAAREHLQRSEALGEQGWVYRHRLCLVKARLKEAQGDLDGALDLLDQAERLYSRSPIPDVRPVAALKTRVWIGQGSLDKAQGWVRERGLSVDDDLTYLREFEHITLARVLIARYRSDRAERPIHQAVGLLERLLRAAQEGGRTGSAIEILLLQALAHHAQGDLPRALVPLERALALAEPEGYVRIFVDEGPPMEALLREAARHGTTSNLVRHYVRRLRSALGKAPAWGKAAGGKPVTQPLIEPLTERELEVLGLLGTELSGPEIARELVVSLNTMRTHTKNIYSKLGVNNREAAVRRAEELDLL